VNNKDEMLFAVLAVNNRMQQLAVCACIRICVCTRARAQNINHQQKLYYFTVVSRYFPSKY